MMLSVLERCSITCPVGEYDVIVNQADGGWGVARFAVQPMPVVSAQPTGSGRMVDLTVGDVGYDDYRYRFVGGGIVGPWVVTKPADRQGHIGGSTVRQRGARGPAGLYAAGWNLSLFGPGWVRALHPVGQYPAPEPDDWRIIERQSD